jgi:hypothetical protein
MMSCGIILIYSYLFTCYWSYCIRQYIFVQSCLEFYLFLEGFRYIVLPSLEFLLIFLYVNNLCKNLLIVACIFQLLIYIHLINLFIGFLLFLLDYLFLVRNSLSFYSSFMFPKKSFYNIIWNVIYVTIFRNSDSLFEIFFSIHFFYAD